ncbi:uncharacterized protein LOC142625089 [Castanea sativa]|uniref:uncharacterized protein LOC142625089 n=1 Tax=Castanea sativa TaxID=21020 RepID=UPI003F652DDC
MGFDLSRRNQNLYCTYHKDKEHTIKQCRVLKDHLEQLVRARYLKEFVVDPRNQGTGQGARPRGNPLLPPLGVIKVIHAASKGTLVIGRRRVLVVVPVESCSDDKPPEKKFKFTREPIAFNDEDLKGTIQSQDDALVVPIWINGFIVKRVLVDQGSGAKVMYPDLFRGLGLKKEDLSKYDTPLLGFDSRMVILEGQIFLPMNMEGKEKAVDSCDGAVPSTLHVKVKFCTKHDIAIVRGNQQMVWQCLVAAVNQEIKQKEPTEQVPL